MQDRTSNIQRTHFTSIQVARALAACVVVIYHTNFLANNFPGLLIDPPYWIHFGFAGVDLFFVVSGFVISVVTDRPRNSVGEFLAKRAVRILPFYWFFTIAWLIISIVGGKGAPTATDLLRSIAVFPTYHLPFLQVGWTLEHELIFYAIVSATLAVKQLQRLPMILAALFIGAFGLHVALPSLTRTESAWDWHLLSLFHFEFLAGVLLYRCRRMVAGVDWRLLMTIGALGFPLGSIALHTAYNSHSIPTQPESWPGLARVIIFGLSSAALIGGLYALEEQKPKMMQTPAFKALDLIGNSSYGLYLLHTIEFSILGVIFSHIKVPNSLFWPVAMASWISAMLIAIAWYKLAERPLLARSSKLFTRRLRPASQPAS
jgi:exopolysaccharide production protein ExoZ